MQRKSDEEFAEIAQRCLDLFDLTGASAEVQRLIASDWIEENYSWSGGCIASLWRLGVIGFPITPIFINGDGHGYGYGYGYGYGDGYGYG